VRTRQPPALSEARRLSGAGGQNVLKEFAQLRLFTNAEHNRPPRRLCLLIAKTKKAHRPEGLMGFERRADVQVNVPAAEPTEPLQRAGKWLLFDATIGFGSRGVVVAGRCT
jgi:hypothetical protein